MISSSFQFIYVHIPKTAGNSIQTALLPISDDKKLVAKGFRGQERFGIVGKVTPSKHATLQQYSELLSGRLDQFLVATSVRHPFERLVSYYFSPHRWQDSETSGDWQTPTFDEESFLALARDLKPMTWFLEISGSIPADVFYIRHECAKRDFASFVTKIGANGVVAELPQLNRSLASHDQLSRIKKSRTLRTATEPFLRNDLQVLEYDLFN
ncbi:sulfotransferase family 2 domain-containing protein [uncultured Shimia sp.]|uniref:sulfotransferase family 2 domain-containing protein n=1 Tax=uncultured Shimia sp. TaxID=573152 RepID=UPI002627AFE5|nr:sulfotransferase family 2 domain-containing protein [uncultured Shimia sp.]